MSKKKLILLVVACLYVGSGFAQKYNIKTYTVNDGLPSSQVYDVIIDDNGLVWFATSYGLTVFDGFTFKKYGIKAGLRDEFIYDIFKDKEDNFWVATESGGVGKLVGDSIVYLPEFSSLDSMTVLFIIQSPNTGHLWFGTYSNGIHVWDGDEFKTITKQEGLPDNRIWDIHFSNENKVWVATSGGVAVFTEGEGVTEVYTKENGLTSNITFQVFEASDGVIWVPTRDGVSLIEDGKVSSIQTIDGEPLNTVHNIAEDSDGLIWIATSRKGLFWYDGEEFTHITKKNGLSSNYIYRLIEAKDGTIWVATEGNGVSIFKDKQFRFFDKDSPLMSNSVFSLYKDEEGIVWIGTDAGIIKKQNDKFEKFDLPDSLKEAGEIWDIDQLPNGNIILLSYNYTILEFDGKSFFRSDYDSLSENYYIMDIHVDNESVWFAEYEGLLKYTNGNVEKFEIDKEVLEHLHLVFEDSGGNLWLGTEGGVAKFNHDTIVVFSEKDGLLGESVYGITEDERGNIWVGTNEGVSVVIQQENNQRARIESFENEEIYMSETIILIHDQNGLWQGTNNGLNYFDTEKWYANGEMNIMYFPLLDNGKGMEFSGGAALVDNNGYLWLGTPDNGLVRFNSGANTSVTEKNMSPQVFIRKMLVNSEVVYDHTNKYDHSIQLHHSRNNVEFEFGAASYKDPNNIFYRYKLIGFDEEWETVFNERKAVYTNLPPGEYAFAVMAKSSKSDWTATPIQLTFGIEKPYWQEIWFIILSLLILAGISYLSIKMYVQFLEKNKLKVLVDEKTKSLSTALLEKEMLIKEIHHRVKNNMAVVSGLLDLQSWQMEEGPAKNALEDSKLRIRAMSSIHEKLYQHEDLTRINFREFTKDLINEISNSLKGAHKDIDVTMEIEVESLDINQAIPCGLILNELISNSYEHAFPDSSSGNIFISFKESGERYELVIEDDGVGIPQEVLTGDRASLGITLIESLSQQLKGTLEFNGENKTRFRLSFPK